jgi:hypothetical protein
LPHLDKAAVWLGQNAVLDVHEGDSIDTPQAPFPIEDEPVIDPTLASRPWHFPQRGRQARGVSPGTVTYYESHHLVCMLIFVLLRELECIE